MARTSFYESAQFDVPPAIFFDRIVDAIDARGERAIWNDQELTTAMRTAAVLIGHQLYAVVSGERDPSLGVIFLDLQRDAQAVHTAEDRAAEERLWFGAQLPFVFSTTRVLFAVEAMPHAAQLRAGGVAVATAAAVVVMLSFFSC